MTILGKLKPPVGSNSSSARCSRQPSNMLDRHSRDYRSPEPKGRAQVSLQCIRSPWYYHHPIAASQRPRNSAITQNEPVHDTVTARASILVPLAGPASFQWTRTNVGLLTISRINRHNIDDSKRVGAPDSARGGLNVAASGSRNFFLFFFFAWASFSPSKVNSHAAVVCCTLSIIARSCPEDRFASTQ